MSLADGATLLDLGHNNTIDVNNNNAAAVSADVINAGANRTFTVLGWDDQIYATTGDVVTISNPGTNPTDTVHISNGTVYLTANSHATISGTNNKVYVASGAGAVFNGGGNQLLHDPLILNLAGEHVQASSLESSKAHFNMLGTGDVHTAWTTANEAFLVDDSAHADKVTSGDNLVSTFEQLKGFDTDHDGVVDARDAGYNELKLWVNSEGDGVFRASELETLRQAGVASINVADKAVDGETNGNPILADSSFTFADGRTGDIADVGLQLSAPQDPYAALAETRFNAIRDLILDVPHMGPPPTAHVAKTTAATKPPAGFAPAAAEIITDPPHPYVQPIAFCDRDVVPYGSDALHGLSLDTPYMPNPLGPPSHDDYGAHALASMMTPAADEVALRSLAYDTGGFGAYDAFGAPTQPGALHSVIAAAHHLVLA